MTITDCITIILFVFLANRGFNRGFLGSLLGPLALIIGSLVSFVYYALTDNIPVSLCIGLFGPFLLAWLFRFFLRSWKKMTNAEGKISLLSQIGGAVLTLSWGMAMWIITLLLLALFPPINNPLKRLSNDIHYSVSYKIISPLDFMSLKKTSSSKSSNNSTGPSNGVSPNVTKSTSEDDLKVLSEDKKILDLMNDPHTIKALNNKDYASLMSNPKIMAIVQDPELIKKMMQLYKKMAEEGTLPKE